LAATIPSRPFTALAVAITLESSLIFRLLPVDAADLLAFCDEPGANKAAKMFITQGLLDCHETGEEESASYSRRLKESDRIEVFPPEKEYPFAGVKKPGLPLLACRTNTDRKALALEESEALGRVGHIPGGFREWPKMYS
jgi:hypothetical protein